MVSNPIPSTPIHYLPALLSHAEVLKVDAFIRGLIASRELPDAASELPVPLDGTIAEMQTTAALVLPADAAIDAHTSTAPELYVAHDLHVLTGAAIELTMPSVATSDFVVSAVNELYSTPRPSFKARTPPTLTELSTSTSNAFYIGSDDEDDKADCALLEVPPFPIGGDVDLKPDNTSVIAAWDSGEWESPYQSDDHMTSHMRADSHDAVLPRIPLFPSLDDDVEVAGFVDDERPRGSYSPPVSGTSPVAKSDNDTKKYKQNLEQGTLALLNAIEGINDRAAKVGWIRPEDNKRKLISIKVALARAACLPVDDAKVLLEEIQIELKALLSFLTAANPFESKVIDSCTAADNMSAAPSAPEVIGAMRASCS